MQIEINNTIMIDEQTEVIYEVYPCEVVQKGGWLYLIYQNDDQEKVVIKTRPNELVMTRFSQPQTHMRFLSASQAGATIPTPMGIQSLVTNSRAVNFSPSDQEVTVSYELLTSPEAELPLAIYNLRINWG